MVIGLLLLLVGCIVLIFRGEEKKAQDLSLLTLMLFVMAVIGFLLLTPAPIMSGR